MQRRVHEDRVRFSELDPTLQRRDFGVLGFALEQSFAEIVAAGVKPRRFRIARGIQDGRREEICDGSEDALRYGFQGEVRHVDVALAWTLNARKHEVTIFNRRLSRRIFEKLHRSDLPSSEHFGRDVNHFEESGGSGNVRQLHWSRNL